MKKLFSSLFLFVFFIFAFIGALQVSTIWHEYSHVNDYKHLSENFTKEDLCFFVGDTEGSIWSPSGYMGYYSFNFPKNNLELKDEVEKIGEYTETKAYSISIIILSIFVISFICFYNLIMKNKELNKENEYLFFQLRK